MAAQHSEFVSFIWSVADDLRGDYKSHEYGSVILPFTVMRRLDQVLSPTREAVRAAAKQYASSPEALRHKMLLRAAGQGFYNTSELDFDRLGQDHIAADLRRYVAGFSPNARDIVQSYTPGTVRL